MRHTNFDRAILVDLPHAKEPWLDLDKIARVAVTSEAPNSPVECAFDFRTGGWRAGGRGEQAIRLILGPPQRIQRIRLCFVESEAERTQEFALRWWREKNDRGQEIVRQQWNFSPQGSTTEIEDYKVELNDVRIVELTINPDIRRRDSVATLAEWRLG